MTDPQSTDLYRLSEGAGGSLYELLFRADREGAPGDTYLVQPREGLIQRLVDRTVLRRQVYVDRPHTDPLGSHAIRARADSLGIEVNRIEADTESPDSDAFLEALRRRVEAGRAFLLQRVGLGQPAYRATDWQPRLFGWALVTTEAATA